MPSLLICTPMARWTMSSYSMRSPRLPEPSSELSVFNDLRFGALASFAELIAFAPGSRRRLETPPGAVSSAHPGTAVVCSSSSQSVPARSGECLSFAEQANSVQCSTREANLLLHSSTGTVSGSSPTTWVRLHLLNDLQRANSSSPSAAPVLRSVGITDSVQIAGLNGGLSSECYFTSLL